VLFGLVLRPAYNDHVRQEEHVRASDLDWTIVRPSAFTDGPATGTYRQGFPGNEAGLSLKISRADIAEFMLDQLTDRSYLHRAVGISN
ncbi:NAD(P)-dependent oxidoreductase, partial [Nocardia cyriacigeorgica]